MSRGVLVFVLSGKHLLHEVIAMLTGQLLAVLALHDGPEIVERIQREVIQVAEGVKNQFRLPLDSEVGIVLN